MNKKSALTAIEKYLKEHFIKYFRDSEDGTERITMIFKGYDKCSDEIIEACIYFFSDSMECSVYISFNCTYYFGTKIKNRRISKWF